MRLEFKIKLIFLALLNGACFALTPIPWCPSSRQLPPPGLGFHRSPAKTNLQGSVQAQLGDAFEFTVYNFSTDHTNLLPSTVRYSSLLNGGMPLTIWVSDSAWFSSSPNNLNHDGVQTFFQADRLSTLQEIARVLEDVIFEQVESKLGTLIDPAQARYTGVHFLLYDIPDSFDQDGSFVGGYFFPEDQGSPNRMNLMHMDLRPSNPAGRNQSNSGTRDDFYHTLAHELFHLYHYQKIGKTAWDSTAEWISEGLAQFAIFWFFENQNYPGSQDKILDHPNEAPGQVSFYLENPELTYLLDYQGDSGALPVEYYGLGYLFFTHLWHGLGPSSKLRNTRLLGLLDNKVDHLPKLESTLSGYNLDLREIFKSFALAQYFENPVYDMDFISLGKNLPLGQFKSPTRIDLDLVSERMKSLRNYELEYLALENNSNSAKRVVFESRCHLGNDDPCGQCSVPPEFDLLQVPDRDEVEACFQDPQFEACFMRLRRNIRAYHGTRVQAKMRPGKSSFIYWTTNNSCDKGFNSIGITEVTAQNYLSLPNFSKAPTLVLTGNRLEMAYEFTDDNSEFAQFSFQVRSEDSNSTFFPRDSLSTEVTTASAASEQVLTWYFLEDVKSLKGRELRLSLKDPQSEILGEDFGFSFFSEPELEVETYLIEIQPGWNMLAFEPENPQDTLGGFFDKFKDQVALDPCVYIYESQKLWALSLDESSCSSEVLTDWRSQPLLWGQGFILRALEEKALEFTRILPSRWKYELEYGWNLRSLGLEVLPSKKDVPPTVPILYRFSPMENLWRKQVFYGLDDPASVFQFQEAFKKYQAHWIYSLRKRDFVRP